MRYVIQTNDFHGVRFYDGVYFTSQVWPRKVSNAKKFGDRTLAEQVAERIRNQGEVVEVKEVE